MANDRSFSSLRGGVFAGAVVLAAVTLGLVPACGSSDSSSGSGGTSGVDGGGTGGGGTGGSAGTGATGGGAGAGTGGSAGAGTGGSAGAGTGGSAGAGTGGSAGAGTGGSAGAGTGGTGGTGGSAGAGTGGSAGAGAGGACNNATDAPMMQTQKTADDASSCGGLTGCFPKQAGTQRIQCVADCMTKKDGFTAACATCWGQVVDCGIAHCATQCFNPNSAGCKTCTDTNCTPAFDTCAFGK